VFIGGQALLYCPVGQLLVVQAVQKAEEGSAKSVLPAGQALLYCPTLHVWGEQFVQLGEGLEKWPLLSGQAVLYCPTPQVPLHALQSFAGIVVLKVVIIGQPLFHCP